MECRSELRYQLGFPMSHPKTLSTELGLLAACDIAPDEALADKLKGARSSGIDWLRFSELALGNGLAGLATGRISKLAPDAVPAVMQERFAGLVRAEAMTHMAQGMASVRLTRILAREGIRSIVLKGQALSHMLYQPAPYWRSSTDIDILIPSDCLDSADRILRDHGFVRQWPEHDPADRGKNMFLLLANVYEYVCQDSGLLIELHHRITLNPSWLPGDFDDLDRSSVDVETGQGTVRGLDGPMLVAYLCWHAFSHFNFRMKWIGDIARALRHVGAGSCAGLCAPEAGFAQAPLALADALLGVVLPEAGTTNGGAGSNAWRKQVGQIISGMENPRRFPTRRSLASLPAELAFRLFLARLSPGLAGKGYEVLRGLTDTRDVAALGLGASFAPLYAIAGPYLAFKRYALGR